MLIPNQFRVNEAWIIVKINKKSLFIENKSYNVYVIMDAASAYVLGFILLKVDESLHDKDVKYLLTKAWMAKRQWAKKLIIPENFIAKNSFKKQVKKNGILIEVVPLSDLDLIVGLLKESFTLNFVGK